MPCRRGTTTRNGKRVGFYQWGTSGKKYTYELGNERSRQQALRRCREQGRAIKASGGE